MSEIILVTGGARSGKSVFAEQLAYQKGLRRGYLATCPVLDEEMRERVERHKIRREQHNWKTVEEEVDLCGAFDILKDRDVVLVDCLTLWINNLLFRNPDFRESDMSRETDRLLLFLNNYPPTVIFVLNEVGLGIVPENPLSRTFRDCSGRCGQKIAAAAKEVYFTVCGIAQKIKGSSNEGQKE